MLNARMLIAKYFKTKRGLSKRNIHPNTLHFDDHIAGSNFRATRDPVRYLGLQVKTQSAAIN